MLFSWCSCCLHSPSSCIVSTCVICPKTSYHSTLKFVLRVGAHFELAFLPHTACSGSSGSGMVTLSWLLCHSSCRWHAGLGGVRTTWFYSHFISKLVQSSFKTTLWCLDRPEISSVVQCNLIITATYRPNIFVCYIQVAVLQSCKCIEPRQLGLELGGYNNGVVAELSDHYTEAPL